MNSEVNALQSRVRLEILKKLRVEKWRDAMKFAREMVAVVIAGSLILLTSTPVESQTQDQAPVNSQGPALAPAGPINPDAAPAQQTPDELNQLVAPIALYPDALVAQVLAASIHPTEIVEADRWMQANTNLQGQALAQQVDQMPWDPSVKALTQFPSVLANMDKNLSWTSSLGEAYTSQEQDVMAAVQTMRQRAQNSGNLTSSSQQMVTTQGSTIVIQPASPQVIYVPAYNPWLIYGPPVVAYPGWVPVPGVWWGGPHISFGIGFGVGYWGGFGWGWNHWGYNWSNSTVIYNRNVYINRSNTFINNRSYSNTTINNRTSNNTTNNRTFNNNTANFNGHNEYRPNGSSTANDHGEFRPGATGLGSSRESSYNSNRMASNNNFNRGGLSRGGWGGSSASENRGMRTSSFSGFNQGGMSRGFSNRGFSSFHGGGGGGGFRRR
jgi:hypothetical protein